MQEGAEDSGPVQPRDGALTEKNMRSKFEADPEGGMRAVTLQFSPGLSVGPATKLFDARRPSLSVSGRPYDVSPVDGRFLVLKSATQPWDRRVTVSIVLNWFEDLTARVPLTGR